MYIAEVIFLNTERIHNLLSGWYSEHFRALPWRTDVTPYHVWISEIMLQQTRIEAALPYYKRFIARIPDVAALASVSDEVLMKLWEGLGYYSRARNLKKAAQVIMETYNGELPADYERLLLLPGIGAYTAGAIASIAFSIPVPAVDGNVMRVLARLSGDDTDVLSTAGKKRFTDLAWELIPEQHPGRFNQALMELGETVCIPGTPKCDLCPLRSECEAHRTHRMLELPIRIKKTKRRVERRAVLFVRVWGDSAPTVLLRKRKETGLLAGLWELPNTEDGELLSALDESLRSHCRLVGELPESRHLFSHIEWLMKGYLLDMLPVQTLPEHYALATIDELRTKYPLPSAFHAYTCLVEELLHKEN